MAIFLVLVYLDAMSPAKAIAIILSEFGLNSKMTSN